MDYTHLTYDNEYIHDIGITFGAFDLCHAGHVLMFAEAKEVCKTLIVGLQTDPSIERPSKNRPVQSLYERYIQLQAVKYIDKIIPYTYEDEIMQILYTQDINVRIIGADYIDKDFTGKQLCIDEGIHIYYNSRGHSFSTTELRGRIGNNTTK
jgi:glycerol-3-phosphate cytidylyltransferase